MSEEELRIKERQARREMPATKAAIDAYRDVLMDNWRASPPSASQDREGIYNQIKALERVEQYLRTAQGIGSEEIEEHAKLFATTEE